MPLEFKIMMIIVIVIMVAIPLVFFFAFWLPNYKSIMKRARQIDPTVKTFAEANLVLQKDVMESVGHKKSEQKDENKDNNENK